MDLHDNNIRALPKHLFGKNGNQEGVLQLNVSDNSITNVAVESIPVNVWRTLKRLDLRSNRLTSLQWLPKSLPGLSLSLSSNPGLECSCENLDILHYYRQFSNGLKDGDEVKVTNCPGDNHADNQLLSEILDPRIRQCHWSKFQPVVIAIVIVFIMFCFALIIFCYRKRISLYNHPLGQKLFPVTSNPDMLEGFLLCSENEQSIAEKLCYTLIHDPDDILKRTYRCSYDEMEFSLGMTKKANLDLAFEKSQRILALISAAFLKDGYCKQALEDVQSRTTVIVFMDKEAEAIFESDHLLSKKFWRSTKIGKHFLFLHLPNTM